MILVLVASLYILVGGGLATALLAGGDHPLPSLAPSSIAVAFALVVGTVLLWPMLLALAIDRRWQR